MWARLVTFSAANIIMGNIHFFDASKGGKNSLGNLEKTINIQHLLETPLHQRDTNWVDRFLENIDECNLQLGEPEVAMANDGFPYMNLKTVEIDADFKAYVIQNELDALLRNGFGVVINVSESGVDWLLSHGDLLNLKLNGEFYTEESNFSEHGRDFVIPQDEKVMIGQPSEQILPAQTRQHIREFLQHSGIHNGKVLLMARKYEDDELASQDMVFNITPKMLPSQEEYNYVMNTVAWFLPKHYSIVGLDESSIESGFELI